MNVNGKPLMNVMYTWASGEKARSFLLLAYFRIVLSTLYLLKITYFSKPSVFAMRLNKILNFPGVI